MMTCLVYVEKKEGITLFYETNMFFIMHICSRNSFEVALTIPCNTYTQNLPGLTDPLKKQVKKWSEDFFNR